MYTTRRRKRAGFVTWTIRVGIALLVILATTAAALWVDGGTEKAVLFHAWAVSSLVVAVVDLLILLIYVIVNDHRSR